MRRGGTVLVALVSFAQQFVAVSLGAAARFGVFMHQGNAPPTCVREQLPSAGLWEAQDHTFCQKCSKHSQEQQQGGCREQRCTTGFGQSKSISLQKGIPLQFLCSFQHGQSLSQTAQHCFCVCLHSTILGACCRPSRLLWERLCSLKLQPCCLSMLGFGALHPKSSVFGQVHMFRGL